MPRALERTAGAEEVEIATIQAPDAFGDAALLNNAPRLASIVSSGTLFTVFITRARFEEVLGPHGSRKLPRGFPDPHKVVRGLLS